MFGQEFSTSDFPTVLTLAFLEGLLSADNALVLALLVRHLPRKLQRKGLLYGLGGAFILRGTMIVVATELIRFWWIQAAGAAYLLYLAARHLCKKDLGGKSEGQQKNYGFWQTVVVIELVDLVFAIDSILAAVALVGPPPHSGDVHPKLWVVYLGGFTGLLAMRFVAQLFVKLLERFRRLETSAYLIVAWIGIKLGIGSYGHYVMSRGNPMPVWGEMPGYIFWPVLLALFLYGFIGAAEKMAAEVVREERAEEKESLSKL